MKQTILDTTIEEPKKQPTEQIAENGKRLIKGQNAIQIYCPKCGGTCLIHKKAESKACPECGYTRTEKGV